MPLRCNADILTGVSNFKFYLSARFPKPLRAARMSLPFSDSASGAVQQLFASLRARLSMLKFKQ